MLLYLDVANINLITLLYLDVAMLPRTVTTASLDTYHIRMHAHTHCLSRRICTLKRIIVHERCKRALRDKLALRVCVRAYVRESLKLMIIMMIMMENEKCHISGIRLSFLRIDCTNLIQTGRNRKLASTLYKKSAVRFLINGLVPEEF